MCRFIWIRFSLLLFLGYCGLHRQTYVLSAKELHGLDLLLCCLLTYRFPVHVADHKQWRPRANRFPDLRVHDVPWLPNTARRREQRKYSHSHVPHSGLHAWRGPFFSLLEITQSHAESYIKNCQVDWGSHNSWSPTGQCSSRKPGLRRFVQPQNGSVNSIVY